MSSQQVLRFFQKKKPSMYITLAALVLLVLVLPLTIFFAKQQQETRQYASTHYLFGTLETANGAIFGQLGLTYAQVALQEHNAGVAVANITLAWKDYETSDGAYNEGQLTYVADNIKTFLQVGQKVDVQLSIHALPPWVMQIPNAYYLNQYGIKAPQVYGFDDPNYVFNATVRQKVQDFETHALQQLNSQVGLQNIFEFRVDGGDGGEANFDPSNDGAGHTNSYWAYDANAQGTGGNLPTGVSSSPFPGWQPGQTTYNGQSFTVSQVQQWYDWYFNSRMNFYNWQVALFRNAGFSGYLPFETPGFGTRPDEYTNNMNHYLNGTYDPNGTMSRAAVWQKLYPAITNKTNIVAYISSIADGSGSPADNLCQASDTTVNFNTDTTVDSWSAVRYVSYIANQYGLLKNGENPGWGAGAGSDYGQVMTQNAAAQMQACGLMGMFYAHDQNLYEGTNNFYLKDYANIIAQYNTTVTPTPAGSTITISAAGTPYNGVYPNMDLRINDTTVATFTNIQGDPTNRVFQTFTYTSPNKISANQVKIVFTNDGAGGGQDRNLMVDKINIDGTDYQSESPLTYGSGVGNPGTLCSSGYIQTEWILCDQGYFIYGQTQPTPTSTLSLTPTLTPISTPTFTPIPTNTPTPLPPTPTFTPVPTPTNTPTPTTTPTLTFTPSPTSIPPDTTPPTVVITFPANGALVRHGATIAITASASDNVGVTQVQFLVNGTLLCSDTSSPYSCVWPVPGKPGVTYTIIGRAYDAMGNAASNSIQVRSTQ